MKMNVMFPSNYLKADDVTDAGGEMTLVISAVAMEALKKQDGSEEQKPVAFFNGTDKKLILNKTNAGRISVLLDADDTDLWIGKTVTLITELVDAFGKTQPAIRVKLTAPKQTQQPAQDNLDLSSEFWSTNYGMGLSKEDGEKIIAENNGDFSTALDAIQAQKDMM